MRKSVQLLAALFAISALLSSRAADSGDSVVVVYNRSEKESKGVAEHYAKQRRVPANQVIGFSLPTSETMSRREFREKLQEPLVKFLETNHLFTFKSEGQGTAPSGQRMESRALVEAKIRYLVLCYGVPARIAADDSFVEKDAEKLPAELRRNDAAVDSELALLPMSQQHYLLAGPLRNLFYGATNATTMQPTNGILLVARLDGPSADIARGLVDKALAAETNGLWGRAYVDLRGLTNGPFMQGENWLRGAGQSAWRYGFDTYVDTKPETFSAGFPMSQIAFYAGWYDEHVSGPFHSVKVEFMPGAFAYHLHSFSAAAIHSEHQHWVGPLLARGATATMGCVAEPYLFGTPDMAVFASRWMLAGFSFGEAAYAAQSSLSWQTTVVGDPLYRPFGKNPEAQHKFLLQEKNRLIEWSHLRAVNLGLLRAPVSRAIQYLEDESAAKGSAILQEKLGELYKKDGRDTDAVNAWRRALVLKPSPQQEIRLRLTLGENLTALKRFTEAAEAYQQLLKHFPDYPDADRVQTELRRLAEQGK